MLCIGWYHKVRNNLYQNVENKYINIYIKNWKGINKQKTDKILKYV